MSDHEFFYNLKEKFKGLKIEDVVSSAIVELVNITTRLELQIRKLWFAVIVLFSLVVALSISGCAASTVNQCEWVCADTTRVPESCACWDDLMEMIKSNDKITVPKVVVEEQ